MAPSRASVEAMASPMPRAAPVTRATLPASGWSQSAGSTTFGAPLLALPAFAGLPTGRRALPGIRRPTRTTCPET